MSVDLSKLLDKPVSELPDGATGYRSVSEQEVLNTLSDDTDVEIIDADEFLAQMVVPQTYSLPRTLNTLEWWNVFNQGSIGSCFGCSDSQTATGVHWLKTGKVQEFSKFGHYVATQLMTDLQGGKPRSLGEDKGSLPTMGLIVAAKWGYCPDQHAPEYPRNYKEGMQSYRQYIEDLKNPDSKIRQAMAPFRMQKYIRITKGEQITKAKKMGVGFVQLSGKWTEAFDAEPETVSSLGGSLHAQHGGHAFQVMDLNVNGGFVIGNTWGQKWGDDGCKTMPEHIMDEYLADPMTICFLKTDMEFVKGASEPTGPREIPIKSSDWV